MITRLARVEKTMTFLAYVFTLLFLVWAMYIATKVSKGKSSAFRNTVYELIKLAFALSVFGIIYLMTR